MTNTKHSAIEAAARAICDVWGYVWDGDPDDAQTAPETYEPYDERPDKVLYRKAADAAILVFRQWLADEGLIVVPREATSDMVGYAGARADARGDIRMLSAEYRSAWAAMIAAAPDVLGEKLCG